MSCKRPQKLQIRTGLSSSRSHVITPLFFPWIVQRLDRKLGHVGWFRIADWLFRSPRWRWTVPSWWKLMWRNDGENVAQTSQNVGFVCLRIFFRSFYCYFSVRLLSYGDGDPSKPHSNLRGKQFLLFCVICPCLWEIASQKLTLPEPYIVGLKTVLGPLYEKVPSCFHL